MHRLELLLRPQSHKVFWQRDLFTVGLLLALAMVLLPGYGAHGDRYLSDAIGQIASVWLLPSLGFLLALRAGVIDMSVWIVFSLGSVTAAIAMAAGIGPGQSMAIGVAAGAGMGIVNGTLAAWSPLPGAVVTLLTAVCVMLLMQRFVPVRQVLLEAHLFDDWHLSSRSPEGLLSLPLSLTRMLLVVGVYGLLLLNIAFVSRIRISGGTARLGIFISLLASGIMAAAGGSLWLIDNFAANVPTRAVDDLRVPAAAVLAGAMLLTGHRRTLLCALYLAPAMLLTTAWRQQVLLVPHEGYSLQMLPLLVGAVIIALAFRVMGSKPGAKSKAGAAIGLATAGLLILAGSIYPAGLARTVVEYAGLGTLGLGGIALAAAALAHAPSPSTSDQ